MTLIQKRIEEYANSNVTATEAQLRSFCRIPDEAFEALMLFKKQSFIGGFNLAIEILRSDEVSRLEDGMGGDTNWAAGWADFLEAQIKEK